MKRFRSSAHLVVLVASFVVSSATARAEDGCDGSFPTAEQFKALVPFPSESTLPVGSFEYRFYHKVCRPEGSGGGCTEQQISGDELPEGFDWDGPGHTDGYPYYLLYTYSSGKPDFDRPPPIPPKGFHKMNRRGALTLDWLAGQLVVLLEGSYDTGEPWIGKYKADLFRGKQTNIMEGPYFRYEDEALIYRCLFCDGQRQINQHYRFASPPVVGSCITFKSRAVDQVEQDALGNTTRYWIWMDLILRFRLPPAPMKETNGGLR